MGFVRNMTALVMFCALGAAPAAAGGAREQCEALTRAAVAMADELLRNHGEFAPYGLGLSAGDEVVAIEDTGRHEGMRAADAGDALRARLAEALKERAVQATALVYEATVALPSSTARGDAVAIQLSHRDGYRAVIVYPYRFEGAEVVFGPSHVIEQKGAALPRVRRKGSPSH